MPAWRIAAVAAHLALLCAFPIAWFAPLMTVNLKLWFWSDGTTISLIGILQSAWAEDPIFALGLIFFAIIAPVLKLLGTTLVLLDLLAARALSTLTVLGKLAMADISLSRSM